MGHHLTEVPRTRTTALAMAGRQELPQSMTVPLGPVMAMTAGAAELRSAATARRTEMAAPEGRIAARGAMAST
jgi:hypothetical protein